ncbi:transcriptional regulator, XRE family [Polaromonas sp. YR568]|uniref:helix-turn-helix domain-containing protein n=1 Tax=Polaromonas sp. YR568 TaxID=1855301 RepID=UPI0008F20B45|nr:helix-turn-helix transcriptional regulator [Polaromonas sp. YR568]SFV02274.1 transcriptional regulator, XRE family [Polaromonas sp. YR568]
MKTLSEIASRLEEERQRLMLDYQTLAERTGLTPLSVRSVLQGRTAPRITTLMAIADQLGLEVLLLPKVVASGLQAHTVEEPPPALSRVDRIVAETSQLAGAHIKSTKPKGA